MTTMSLEKSDPIKIRMAVLNGSTPQPIATVLLVGNVDGEIQISASGNDPTQVDAIAAAAQDAAAAIAGIGLPLDQQLSEMQKAIREGLHNDGYRVEDLPTNDFNFTFELDLKSGRSISRQNSLHNLAIVDESIGRNIHAAISKVFENGPLDFAARLESLVEAGDHAGAAKAVEAERGGGMGFFGVLPIELLHALQKIQVAQLDNDACNLVRRCRIAVATTLDRYAEAENDASELLKHLTATADPERPQLQNIIAIALMRRGAVETALSIWRKLLLTPQDLEPSVRGWTWRNLSLAVRDTGGEATTAARMSIDAFLEAGDTHEAATSMMLLSKLLEAVNPAEALEKIDGMLEIISKKNGLLGEELQAAIHHARAGRLLELRSFRDAYEAALKAVELRRGILGLEEHLISSLHLASVAAKGAKDFVTADHSDAEAQALAKEISSSHFEIATRIQHLFLKFDRAAADALVAEARENGDADLIAGAVVAAATTDPDLDFTARLSRLEDILLELERSGADTASKRPVLTAIASTLSKQGELVRAATWLRRIVDSNPLSLDARDMLIDCLWRAEDWGGAAIFTKSQLDLHGESASMLYAYGRSLVEAGNVSVAIPELTKGLKLLSEEHHLHKAMMELRNRALDLGGTSSPSPVTPSISKPVLREELEQAIREFATFVAANKRMGFWTAPGGKGDYAWISQPEQRAQDLLHTFLKARFQNRITLFEELGTGAGRLDLLLQLDGGLSVIVELKMCGFGYSAPYAASGEEQIRHYMENRDSHLGYLVVFDSRLDDFGSQLIHGDDINTIAEIFVDVRPRVRKRNGKN